MSEPKQPTVLLEHYLKKLKLPTMLREYASMAAVCTDDRADYPTYLLRLTERELLDRETRAAERRVKDARFPVTKTIDTFDFKAQPSINEPLIRELLECREDRTLLRFQKQLERQQLLVLDELGYVPFPKAGAELFFEVVSRAYERQSLMVTTNLPFES